MIRTARATGRRFARITQANSWTTKRWEPRLRLPMQRGWQESMRILSDYVPHPEPTPSERRAQRAVT
eukprot:4486668-Prymnesium_polylepis.1